MSHRRSARRRTPPIGQIIARPHMPCCSTPGQGGFVGVRVGMRVWDRVRVRVRYGVRVRIIVCCSARWSDVLGAQRTSGCGRMK
jgi:hypothetical protein